MPCPLPGGFNRTKHMFTSECLWGCKPGYYKDSNLACPPCVDLFPDGSAYGVYDRVRKYTTSQRAHAWIHNMCGLDGVVVPGAAALFLRNVARYVYGTGVAKCGDSLLSVGEQCDDGNGHNGDGCSASCQYEHSLPPFDCDLIGSQCERQCGWSGSSMMTGYTLPTVDTCANISYYDYATTAALGAGGRLVWLQERMVSCVCSSQFMQLPFSECNITNQGCRECLPGQYHQVFAAYPCHALLDVIKSHSFGLLWQDFGIPQCVACGSTCPPGYRPFPDGQAPLCGPSVKTSALIGEAADVAAAIGCQPCAVRSALVNGVSYISEIQGMNYIIACDFACKASALVSSSALTLTSKPTSEGGSGYYCTNASLKSGGAFAGICRPCTCSDSNMCRGTGIDLLGLVGRYWGSCKDGDGITIQPCDDSVLPQGAIFTGNADYGQSRGCSWRCAPGWQLTPLGTCVECSEARVCPSGFGAVTCDGDAGYAYCQPCFISADTLPPLNAYETWGVGCEATCAAGAYSETPLSDPVVDIPQMQGVGYEAVKAVLVCTACTSVQCQLGESVVGCGASMDGSCVLCSSINGELPPNMQYVTPGVCDTVCVRGFYFNDDIRACLPCASHQCILAGYVRSTDCVAMEDRMRAPTCVSCPPPPVGAEFRSSCAWGCILGYIPDAVRGKQLNIDVTACVLN